MAKTKQTLTLNNAPKASGALAVEDTVDVTEALAKLDDGGQAAAPVQPAAPAAPHHEVAAGKLAEFRLSPLAKGFLDRALVNVSENTGRGLEDEQARAQAQLLGGIITAAGHDLGTAIDFIIGGAESTQAVGTIYSLCYAVQKAVNFGGNMAYRKALDPRGDTDLPETADIREDHVDAPVGLGPDTGEELAFDSKTGERLFNVRGGMERKANYEQIFDALEEVHIYLQLTVEAFGWPPVADDGRDNTMPYCVVQEKDGSFKQIHSLEHCLDIMEIRYKESRRKRAEQKSKTLSAVLAHAQAMMKKAAAK